MVPPLRLPAALLGMTALLVTAVVLTACEDKDPLVDGSPTAQQAQRQQDAAGSDEQYMKDLCTAVDRFQDDFSKALGSPTASDEADVLTQLLKAMGPPAEQLANDLDTEDEAISLMSVGADFGVTQVVDANWGVHGTIRKNVFRCD